MSAPSQDEDTTPSPCPSDKLQEHGRALNDKMISAVREMVDDLERTVRRKIFRKSVECNLNCLDEAGMNQSNVELRKCLGVCQKPVHLADQWSQSKIDDMHSKWYQAMEKCQENLGGNKKNATQAEKDETEALVLNCFTRTVDNYIKLLKPLRTEIETQLDRDYLQQQQQQSRSWF